MKEWSELIVSIAQLLGTVSSIAIAIFFIRKWMKDVDESIKEHRESLVKMNVALLENTYAIRGLGKSIDSKFDNSDQLNRIEAMIDSLTITKKQSKPYSKAS